LLDAEVAGVPTANHEVASIGGFLDDALVVKRIALRADKTKMD
jgi:hypothetical protein